MVGDRQNFDAARAGLREELVGRALAVTVQGVRVQVDQGCIPVDGPKGRWLSPDIMQHVLQISRKIDYGLRAMIHLAAQPAGSISSLQDLATTLSLPREFLAKILKVLAGS